VKTTEEDSFSVYNIIVLQALWSHKTFSLIQLNRKEVGIKGKKTNSS